MGYNDQNLKFIFGNILHLFTMLEQVIEENEKGDNLYIRSWITKNADQNWKLSIKLSPKKVAENEL